MLPQAVFTRSAACQVEEAARWWERNRPRRIIEVLAFWHVRRGTGPT